VTIGAPGGGPGGPAGRGGQAADIARITFTVLFIGLLLGGALWVARPFVGPLIWAVTIVVATWGLMLRLQGALWGRRALAVTAMTLLLLLLLVLPLALAVVTLVDGADEMATLVRRATEFHLPELAPRWLVELPLVGGTLERLWSQVQDLGLRDLWPRVSPYAGGMTRWFVGQLGGVGAVLLQFLLTVVIAAVLWSTGEDAARLVTRFARRLGGERGVGVVVLAGGAIRGVALGVGVTALVQAVISGLGLALAGVPLAGLLTALTFMLCIAQIGPVPVLLPAALWCFWQGRVGWGVFLLVVTAVVATLDNVLRPLLIRLGADLSLLLIFAGVIGGLIAFGLVGIFVGPVVLAVGATLLEAWIADGEVVPPAPDWRD
jgi:predicted PurR-regulated permease PerM